MPSKSGASLEELLLKWRNANNVNEANSCPPIDVVNLTWLLKAIGFKLDFMDFLPGEAASNTKVLSIDLKCSVSGCSAKLTREITTCVCPSKKENSFWEVTSHATKGTVLDASSSLMPKVSENCALVSKAILANLLSYYRECIEESEKPAAEQVQAPKGKLKIPAVFDSPTNPKPNSVPSLASISSTLAKLKVEHQETFDLEKEKMPEILLDEVDEQPRNAIPCPSNSDVKADLSPLGSSIGSLDGKLIATSSPNEKAPSPAFDRDAHIINSLNTARKNIDQALVYMNFNVTQDLSDAHARAPTPMGALPMKDPVTMNMKRSNTFASIATHKVASAQKPKTEINRRSSFGIKPPLLPSPVTRTRTTLGPDTPRPLKATSRSIAVRTPSSAGNLSATGDSSFNRPQSFARKSMKLASNAPSLIERFKMQKKESPQISKKTG